MNQPIRVLIVEDQPIMRAAIASLLHRSPRFDVVGELGDATDLHTAVSRLRPDVVLLDLMLPSGDPLHHLPVDATVLAFSGEEDLGRVNETLRHGVAGFVSKSVSAHTLRSAITRVVEGETDIVLGLEDDTVARPGTATSADESFDSRDPRHVLSPRELVILRYLIGPGTSREIADALQLSRRTIETHRANIRDKLGPLSRADLAKLAREYGIAPELP